MGPCLSGVQDRSVTSSRGVGRGGGGDYFLGPSEQRARAQSQDPKVRLLKDRGLLGGPPLQDTPGNPPQVHKTHLPAHKESVVWGLGGPPFLCCSVPTHVLHFYCIAGVVSSKVLCK